MKNPNILPKSPCKACGRDGHCSIRKCEKFEAYLRSGWRAVRRLYGLEEQTNAIKFKGEEP